MRGKKGKGKSNDFSANAPKQESAFDDVRETKLSKKEAHRARFASSGLGLGAAAGRLGIGAGTSALGDLDVFDFDSDSDDAPAVGVRARRDSSSSDDNMLTTSGLARGGLPGRRKGAAGLLGIGNDLSALGSASFAVDFRTVQPPPGGGQYTLPGGIEMINGDPLLEEQEDGAMALVLPEGAHLKCTLRCSPWILQEDGRLHQWTLCCAMRLDRLPASALALVSGRPAPASGEKSENVQVYKNGGVGALGHMGTQEAALRAERWAWVVVTRKGHEMHTYVNGALCAKVPIPPQRQPPQAPNRPL